MRIALVILLLYTLVNCTVPTACGSSKKIKKEYKQYHGK